MSNHAAFFFVFQRQINTLSVALCIDASISSFDANGDLFLG